MSTMLLFVTIVATVCFSGCTADRQPEVGTSEPAGESPAPFMNSPVVEDGAVVEQVSTGHGFTEGPVVDAAGNLYFADIPQSVITRIAPDGTRTAFVRRAASPNGLAIDKNGVLIAALAGDRCVVEIDSLGNYTVLADRYEGKRFNNPNDLWVDANNGIYFTDPSYHIRLTVEQDGEQVYYISPDRKTVTRMTDDLSQPNGIVGTPDNRYLYVADSGHRRICRFAINPDASLTDKITFVERGSDSMTLDGEGNLYITSGGVQVYNSRGMLIETIRVPESPANVCFGGPDRRTLYITARTSVYSLRMKVRGIDGL